MRDARDGEEPEVRLCFRTNRARDVPLWNRRFAAGHPYVAF